MSNGIHGHGTTLSGSGVGTIGEILDVNGPGIQVDEIDFSSMDSSEKWREFKAGMKNGGEVSFEMHYFKTTEATIQAAVGGANETFTLTFPDSSTDVFTAFIKGKGRSTPYEGGMKSSVTLKVSGKPVFTAG